MESSPVGMSEWVRAIETSVYVVRALWAITVKIYQINKDMLLQ